MNDAFTGGVVEARAMGASRRRPRDRHGRAGFVFKRAARQVFHHQVGLAVDGAEIVHFQVLGCERRARRVSLAFETFEHLRMVGSADEIDTDEFDGHAALEVGIKGAVNSSHTALAQALKDVVVSDVPADPVIHR